MVDDAAVWSVRVCASDGQLAAVRDNSLQGDAMSNISVNDIIVDDFVYARDSKDSKNIDVLIEKLKAGIELHPVLIQRVSGYSGQDEAILLVDGGHRLDAYTEFSKLADYSNSQPQFVWYKDDVLDYEEYKSELLVYGHNINDGKGMNSRKQDTRKVARNLKFASPEKTAAQIGVEIHRAGNTISEYIKDILQQERATAKRTAVRLSRLGWSQTEIGEVIGKSQNRVSEIIGNVDTDFLDNSYKEGKSIEEIASFNDLDVQTVWSILLEDKADTDKLDELNVPLKLYDVWNFSSCDDKMGTDYPGRIPGQLIMNVLYYCTSPGDLVVDPMAGGGTVVDACLLMSRRCKAYDLVPSREDIIQNDIEVSLPEEVDKCKLVFLDPPYWSMLADKYDEDAVSAKTLEEFNGWIKNLAVQCHSAMRSGSYLVFLIQNQTEKDIPTDEHYLDHVFTAYRAFTDAGFRCVRRVACPLSSETFLPQQVNKAKEELRLLGIVRDLLIMVKE